MADWARIATAAGAGAAILALGAGAVGASAWLAMERGKALEMSLKTSDWWASAKQEPKSEMQMGMASLRGKYVSTLKSGKELVLAYEIKHDPIAALMGETRFEAVAQIGEDQIFRGTGALIDGGSLRFEGTMADGDWGAAAFGKKASVHGGALSGSYDARGKKAEAHLAGSALRIGGEERVASGLLESLSLKANFANLNVFDMTVRAKKAKMGNFSADSLRLGAAVSLEGGKYGLELSATGKGVKEIGERDAKAGALDASLEIEGLARAPFERLKSLLARSAEGEAWTEERTGQAWAAAGELSKAGWKASVSRLKAGGAYGGVDARGEIRLEPAKGKAAGISERLAFSADVAETGDRRLAPAGDSQEARAALSALGAPEDGAWAPYRSMARYENGRLVINGESREAGAASLQEALLEIEARLGIAAATPAAAAQESQSR